MTRVQVEVVYALPEKQYQLVVILEYGNTVEQAIRASGIQKIRPEIDFTTYKVGIYSNLVRLSQILKEGDRIEIYRPLTVDPKELRRLRAKYMSGDQNRN